MAKKKEANMDTTKKEVKEKKQEKVVTQEKETKKKEDKKVKEKNKDKKIENKEAKKVEVPKEIKEGKAIVEKENTVSIQDIKKTIDKKQNLPKEEQEKIHKYLWCNIIVAIIVMVYLIFLSLGAMNIQAEIYTTDLKVFSMCVLLLAIAIFEKAYKKDDGQIAVFGIEMMILSIITVALIYVYLMFSSQRYAYIVASISHIFAIYYLVKCIIIYVRKRKKYFVDDMKEIINNKEEE